MRYELKAIAPGGNVEAVAFQAPDEATAVRQLESRGYSVLSVRARGALNLRWASTTRFPLSLFSQELRALLNAGLPLVEAIDTLAQKERNADLRAVIQRLVAVLREGQPLSIAMQTERTGELAVALSRYVAYQAQVEAVRKRVINASIYPVVLMIVGGLVALFLLLYVVPRFGAIYAERGGELPLFSRLLLSWGQAVDKNGLAVLGILGVVLAAVVYGINAFKNQVGNALWRIPAIGERMQVYQLARFYRTIGMLLRGGMPLVAALDLGAEQLHPLLRGRLAAAAQAIREGRGVAQSMDANGLATPVALRMLAVGEKGGNMGEMLEQIATFHDEELARWVDWFTRLFEPLLMAGIGLVIGVVVILMYMPIFELVGNLR
jgi:general secretion pathway protein F